MKNYQLFHGDCLEIMKEIPDHSVDMILCDLPYGVTHNKSDIIIPFEPLWAQYKRITKPNGCIALFGQGLFYVDLVNSNRQMFRYDLVWDKILTSGFLNAKKMPLRQHEQIAIFYTEPPVYNPQFSEGKPSHDQGTKYLSKEPNNNNYGDYRPVKTELTTKKYPTSIIRFQKPHPSKAMHRTEKSIECLEYLIKTYTNEGDTVLDNCMGAGSTGLACMRCNRRFIGIELDNQYYQIAESRLDKFNV